MRFGILDLLQVTVLVSVFALVLAMPIALGVAFFVTQYAPRRVAGLAGLHGRSARRRALDHLRRVGPYVLAPQLRPVATWLNHTMGWCFLFARGNASVAGGGTIFTGGIVLAVMILPIVTAVTREVFVQTPQDQIEAALALGATRWEVVKTTVLPFGRSGYFSGAMLGLGRALGETVALLIILRGTQTAFGWSLFDGGSTFATQIAGTASEFNDQYKAGAYIAAGLVLFLFTFVVDSAGARGGRRNRGPTGRSMTSILDRPLKPRTFSGLGSRRRIANIVATVLVTLSTVIALAPLVLVLYSVIAKGFKAIRRKHVVDAFASGYDGIRGRRRRVPRDRRHPAAGIGMRRDLRPDRSHGRGLSGRVRWRHCARQAGHLHGGHPVPVCPRSWRHCSSTRCVWRRWGCPVPSSRCRWRWCC